MRGKLLVALGAFLFCAGIAQSQSIGPFTGDKPPFFPSGNYVFDGGRATCQRSVANPWCWQDTVNPTPKNDIASVVLNTAGVGCSGAGTISITGGGSGSGFAGTISYSSMAISVTNNGKGYPTTGVGATASGCMSSPPTFTVKVGNFNQFGINMWQMSGQIPGTVTNISAAITSALGIDSECSVGDPWVSTDGTKVAFEFQDSGFYGGGSAGSGGFLPGCHSGASPANGWSGYGVAVMYNGSTVWTSFSPTSSNTWILRHPNNATGGGLLNPSWSMTPGTNNMYVYVGEHLCDATTNSLFSYMGGKPFNDMTVDASGNGFCNRYGGAPEGKAGTGTVGVTYQQTWAVTIIGPISFTSTAIPPFVSRSLVPASYPPASLTTINTNYCPLGSYEVTSTYEPPGVSEPYGTIFFGASWVAAYETLQAGSPGSLSACNIVGSNVNYNGIFIASLSGGTPNVTQILPFTNQTLTTPPLNPLLDINGNLGQVPIGYWEYPALYTLRNRLFMLVQGLINTDYLSQNAAFAIAGQANYAMDVYWMELNPQTFQIIGWSPLTDFWTRGSTLQTTWQGNLLTPGGCGHWDLNLVNMFGICSVQKGSPFHPAGQTIIWDLNYQGAPIPLSSTGTFTGVGAVVGQGKVD